MAKPPSRSPKIVQRGLATDGIRRSAPPRSLDPAQAPLPFDPMPQRIEPCLALLVSKPPVGPDWAFEIKFDGYRLAIHVEPTGVRVLTRGGHDWTHRFPSIAKTAAGLAAVAILDGEAVVLDAQGRSDFGALQRSLGGRGGRRASGEALFFAFDLLYLEGHDLTGMSLDERRAMLATLLEDAPSDAIRLSDHVEADGGSFLRAACKMGLEGIIAKRRDRPYRPGRTGDWLKIKCIQSDSFLIVGYEPSAAVAGAIGSLLVAARMGTTLAFVGGVGTGFNQRAARDLKRRLDKDRTTAPVVAVKGKTIVFVTPKLIAEIAYRGWTHDGKLRHASYKGLRDEADAADVLDIAHRPPAVDAAGDD